MQPSEVSLRVKLVTSPHVRHPAVLQSEFRSDQSVMYGFAPVGLLSLLAVVRRDLGFEPELFDLNRRITSGSIPLGPTFYQVAAAEICNGAPDVVGFMTECDSYHHVIQICEQIQKYNAKCKIVLGGPHATAVALKTLTCYSCIDAIVLGEAEKSFPALLRCYLRGSDAEIAGVLRRQQSGSIVGGKPAQLVDDLDELPIPAYDRYEPDPGEEVFVEVGRGCPFSCTFCSTAPFWRRRHRVKSPDRVLREIAEIQVRYGVRRVHFTHDLFTTDRRWVESLCAKLTASGAPVRWTCSARTDLVDDELLEIMATAGCDAIYFGLESGSQKILKEINKDIPVSDSLAVLRMCRQHGIKPNAGFILGFPSDTVESVSDTFVAYASAISIGCRPTHIFGYCPFAASSIYTSLGDMECTGHFVDLPLGLELDLKNRELIAGNRDLFGSYFRRSAETTAEWPAGFFDGIDEFSALVEAVTLPTLALASEWGGVEAVYRKWLPWIHDRNQRRACPSWRQYYGNALDYCDFLEEGLVGTNASPGISELTRVIRIGADLTRQTLIVPTTMAAHRSYPSLGAHAVDLGTRLQKGSILQKLALSVDVSAALNWEPGDEWPRFEPKKSFLVWQLDTEGHDCRLLDIDAMSFALVREIEQSSVTVAELISRWMMDAPVSGWDGDFHHLLNQVGRLVESGLVSAAGDDKHGS